MSDVNDTSSVSDPNDDYTGSDAGQQSVEPSDGEGRTLDNVRGELIRKNERLASEVGELKGMVQEMAEGFRSFMQTARPSEPDQQPQSPYMPGRNVQQYAPGPVSPFGAPRQDLAQYTDEQLNQVLDSPQFTEYQKTQIRGELATRSNLRMFEGLLNERDAKAEREQAQKEAKAETLRIFPAYRDKNSEFHKRVQAELQKQRKAYGEFPRDEFDVANRVAREMNVEVTRHVGGYSAPGDGGNKPAPGPAEPEGVSEEEVSRLAERFKYAMPVRRNPKTGKQERVKFNTKRVQERSKMYKQSEGLFKSKKVIG